MTALMQRAAQPPSAADTVDQQRQVLGLLWESFSTLTAFLHSGREPSAAVTGRTLGSAVRSTCRRAASSSWAPLERASTTACTGFMQTSEIFRALLIHSTADYTYLDNMCCASSP